MFEKDILTIHRRNPAAYYQSINKQLKQAGCTFTLVNNPDQNMIDIGQYIVDMDLAATVYAKYKFSGAKCGAHLAPNVTSAVDPLRGSFQFHGDGKTSDVRIEEKYNLFYGDDAQVPNNCVIGQIFNGKLYILIGNARVEAALKAEKEGKPAVFTLLLITSCDNEDKAIKSASTIASLGNRNRKERNDPEDRTAIINKLKQFWAFERKSGRCPSTLVDWADEWLRTSEPTYEGDHKKGTRTGLINETFSIGRGTVLANPSANGKKDFKLAFGIDWDESNSHVVMKTASWKTEQHIEFSMLPEYKKLPIGKNKQVYMMVKVGSTDKNEKSSITVTDVVLKHRKALIKYMTNYMINPKFQNDSWPQITKVMFVEQLRGQSCEAYEWEPSSQSYVGVYPPI